MRLSLYVMGVELIGVELDHRAPPGRPPAIEGGPGGLFERAVEELPGGSDGGDTYGFRCG